MSLLFILLILVGACFLACGFSLLPIPQPYKNIILAGFLIILGVFCLMKAGL